MTELEAARRQTLPFARLRTAAVPRPPRGISPTADQEIRDLPVRLLIITDAWFPQINGVVRTLSTTRDKLIERGHEVEVLGPDRFRNVPCPTYPEIRLAVCTPVSVGQHIEAAAPEAVHIPRRAHSAGPRGAGSSAGGCRSPARSTPCFPSI